MNCKHYLFTVFFLLSLVMPCRMQAQVGYPSWNTTDCNALDDLSVGSLAESGSDFWFNFPEAETDATITSEQTETGNRALRLLRPNANYFDDVVYALDGATSGRYRIEWSMFLPAGSAATAGLVNDFDQTSGAGSNWAYRIEFDGSGLATVLLGQSNTQLTSISYPRGRWFKVAQVIDLDTDFIRMFIDFNHVADWNLSDGEDTPGNLSLDVINIWAKVGSELPASQSPIYIDNMCVSLRNDGVIVDCFEPNPTCLVGEDLFNECVGLQGGYVEGEWTLGSCEGGGGEGNICEIAIPLDCNTTYYGDNFESSNDYGVEDYDCHSSSSSYDGGDDVFVINHPGGRFVVSLMNDDNIDFDLFLHGDAGCDDNIPFNLEPGQNLPFCIDKSTNAPGGTFNREMIYYEILEPGIYYLVVDAPNSDQVGSYELALSCEFNCLFTEDFLSCGNSVNGRIPSRQEEPFGNFTSNYCGINTTIPGTGITGNERSYRIEIPTAGSYTFDLSVPGNSSADFELILVNAVPTNDENEVCGLFDQCQGLAVNGGFGDPESLTVSLQPGSYILIVDGWFGSFGDYTLSMSCDGDECEPIFSDANNFTVNRTEEGTYRFVYPTEASTDDSYLVNNVRLEESGLGFSFAGNRTLTIDFGNNTGFTQVCYPIYENDDDCVDYRCINLCVELPAFTGDISVENNTVNGSFDLTLEADNSEIGDFQWYTWNLQLPLLSGPSDQVTYSLDYTNPAIPCGTGTYFVRYFDFDTNCYRFAQITIYRCNPYACDNLAFEEDPSGNGLRLRLGGSSRAPWIFTNDNTGEVLSTNSNTLLLPFTEECYTVNICVQYFDLALDATRVCCTTEEVCPPLNCPDPAFLQNCGDRSQVLSLTANGDFFIEAEGDPELPWLIDREVTVFPQNGGITLSGTNSRNVEVCYPVTDANGCTSYCCQQYCLDGRENSPQVLYDYDQETNSYQFELAEDGEVSQAEWISLGDAGPPISGTGSTASVPTPANCTTQTYYVRYFSDGCWRIARRTVYLCDPYVCDGIGYQYVEANNTFNLSIDGADASQPLAWVDDDTGAGLGTTPSIPVPVPPGDCQTRNISVRYYDSARRAWVICCRTIYLCDPNQCDGIAYQYIDDTQAFDLSIPGADVNQPIAWVDDDTGADLGGGATIPVPIPPGNCQTRNISVRYYDPVRQGWVICCRTIYLCAPSTCEDLIGFNYNDGVAIVSANIGDATRVWSINGETRGIGSTLAVDITPGQSVEVCVQYFSPEVNGFRTCCRTIFIPDCQLPQVDFFFTEEDGVVSVENATNAFGEADYLWDFGGIAQSGERAPAFPTLPPGTYTVCLTVTNDCGTQRLCRRVTIPDTDNDLIFRPSPSTCGRAGQIVEIPITALNFQNILNYQFSLGLTDTTVAKIVGIDLASFPGSLNALIHNAGRVSIIFDSQVGLSYPDGTLVMTLQVEIQGNGPLTSDILLYSEPVLTYAENGNAEEIGLSVLRGTISSCSDAVVSGRVRNEAGRGIARATVSLLRNGVVVEQQITDTDGTYGFTITRDGANYAVRPAKLINYRNHVNSGDLSAIRRHIFNDAPLPGPYRRIAADVGNISSINSGDISLIRQLIFGLVGEFPGVPSWEFVPASHVFSNPDQPTSTAYPRQIDLGILRGDLVGLDFIGVKMGDPSSGADPENVSPGSSVITNKSLTDLAFSVGEEQPIKGVPWNVNVYAHNFRDMVAAQFSMAWDSSVVDFFDVRNFNEELGITADNFSLALADNGRLPWLWFAERDPVSMPDSTLLFTISFNVFGEVGDSVNIRFTDSPTVFYFENDGGGIDAALPESNYVITQLTSNDNPSAITGLAVLPNPVAESFTIEGLAEQPYDTQLLDVRGREVRFWAANRPGDRLSIASIPSGVYFVRVRQGKRVATLRLVVQR